MVCLMLIFTTQLGVKEGFEEASRGAAFPIPKIFWPITKFLCPMFLLTIFFLWLIIDVIGVGGAGIDHHITDLFGGKGKTVQPVAWFCVITIVILYTVFCMLVSRVKRYKEFQERV